MKKITLIILLLAVFLTAGSVQATLVFENQDLSEAVQEVADIKGENIIFLDDLDGKVSQEISLDQDFETLLDKLLADTGYRAVAHSSHYLIGRFSHDSAEFASKSETFFYQADYLAPEVLADELDMEDLRMRVMEDRDELMLQGLPADIAAAREKLVAIDVADSLHQIQYNLAVIDITEESSKSVDLSEAAISSDQDDGFEFLYSDGSIEVLTSEIISQLAGTAEESELEALSIANPSLITEVGSTGTLNMSEEVLSWDQAEAVFQEIEFSTELHPLNITGGGEIETEIDFSVGSGTDFSTTARLPAGETELIGLLKMSEDKVHESLTGKSEYQQERTYAIYITAGPAETGPAASLGGIDNLIFQDRDIDYVREPSHFQVLADDQFNLDLDFQVQDETTGNLVDFKSRSGISHLEFGLGLPVTNGLAFSSRAVIYDQNQLSWLIGLTDNVEITENLKLSAGLYPLVVSLNEAGLDSYAGFGQISYHPDPLLFNLRYSHNTEEDPLRVEAGVNLRNLPYLMAAATADSDGFNRLLFGLRFQF